MKLQDCILEVNKIVVSSQEYIGPDEKWLSVKEKGYIPKSLFSLYSLADYFGFGKAPSFFNDTRRLLFPFMEGMARGIMDSLCESTRLLNGMPDLHERSYSPIKRFSGQAWDQGAIDELNRSFRYLVVNLTATLDLFTEIAALILYPALRNVTPGRASFSQLKEFIRSHRPTTDAVQRPLDYLAGKLATSVIPFVDCSGDEKDWLELLFLYRNKLAHLGTSAFQYMAFHDAELKTYTFLPRRWPLFHKQAIQATTGPSSPGPVSVKDVAERELMHCDLIEYSQRLTQKVIELLEVGLSVICESYKLVKDFPANESVADEIMRQSKHYDFIKFND